MEEKDAWGVTAKEWEEIERVKQSSFAEAGLSEAQRVMLDNRREGDATRRYLSGEAFFAALNEAVDYLRNAGPPECDVLVQAFGVNVLKVIFVEPYAFILRGYDNDGNETHVIGHFSQLLTTVVYLPKKGPERVITGFHRESSNV